MTASLGKVGRDGECRERRIGIARHRAQTSKGAPHTRMHANQVGMLAQADGCDGRWARGFAGFRLAIESALE